MPPAFILSQDQTLHLILTLFCFCYLFFSFQVFLKKSTCNFSSLVLVRFFLLKLFVSVRFSKIVPCCRFRQLVYTNSSFSFRQERISLFLKFFSFFGSVSYVFFSASFLTLTYNTSPHFICQHFFIYFLNIFKGQVAASILRLFFIVNRLHTQHKSGSLLFSIPRTTYNKNKDPKEKEFICQLFIIHLPKLSIYTMKK